MSGSNGALAAGEKIQVSSNGGASWTDVTPTTATSWSLTTPPPCTARASPIRRRIVDSAGNVGTSTPVRPSPSTHGAGGGAGDHGDCQRQRHGWRLHHQRHHADRVGQQRGAGGGREDPGQQRRRRELDRCHPDHGTSWSYDDTATVHGTSFTYQARIVDTAGNVGTTASQAITIDTTAPSITGDLAITMNNASSVVLTRSGFSRS